MSNYVFAVSDNKNETSLDGQKIYNIDELKYFKEKAIVIIAASKRHHESIRARLQKTGFEHILAVE
ncbi:hypothetical protein FMM80_08370 [Schaedlerella arabinosiphila]|uniref:Uncharacterized protein n=1 Tax=Schaedlerella arabinosiphila TaxID=2044587 RepID=A0A9X5H631_9FIRM|nr:hypothetical protein [Schaedlerella arabinosiphila]NDO68693.1 hypothetical protein [Schaedlerella arabinosiphila]